MTVDPLWLRDSAGFLIDLDGTLIRNGKALPGAARLLQNLGDRFMVVSNNSTDLAPALSRVLRHLDLSVDSGQLLLAGEQTVRRLARDNPGRRVLVAGSQQLRNLAGKLGLVMCDREPETIILARDLNFSYKRLWQISNLLRAGAELVVTNPDQNHPGPGSEGVVPETGSLMRAVVACSGVVPTLIFGKPEPPLFAAGADSLGLAAEQITMIGDNPDTDVLGARRYGCRHLLLGNTPECHAETPEGLLCYRGAASL